MKKILIPLLMYFFLNTNFANAKVFYDVDKNHENYLATQYLSAKGIIKGYDDDTFKPNREINRAELLKILLEGAGVEINAAKTNCFNDTPYLQWYNPYTCRARQIGIVEGYADGSFKPWQTVNHAEALKMIGEVYQWDLKDENKINWYEPYFVFAKEKNLFLETEYYAEENMTRGSVAEIIYRFLILTELKIEKFNPQKTAEIMNLIKTAEAEHITEKVFYKPQAILSEGEIKIILTWDQISENSKTENPIDKLNFEAHLIKPNGEEIDFLNKTDQDLNVFLELDENSEKITIRNLEEGNYEFFIYQYSGNLNFSEAGVKVEVYDQNGLAALYQPENNSNPIWEPFGLDGSKLIDKNSFGDCGIIKNITIVCPKPI